MMLLSKAQRFRAALSAILCAVLVAGAVRAADAASELVKFAINPRTGMIAFGDRFDFHDELASRVGAVDDYVWGEYARGSDGKAKLHIGVNTLQDPTQRAKWGGEYLGRYLSSDQFAATEQAKTFQGAQVIRARQAAGYYDPAQGIVPAPVAASGTTSVLAGLPPRESLSRAKQGLYDQLMIAERNGLRNLDTPGENPLYPKKFFPLVDLTNSDGSKFISHERSGDAARAEYKLTKLLEEVGRRRQSAVDGLKKLGLLGANDHWMTFFDRVEVRVPAELVEEARAILAKRIANVNPVSGQITFSLVNPRTGEVTSGFPGGNEFVQYLMRERGLTGDGLLHYFLNKIQGYNDANGALVTSTPAENRTYLPLPENPLKPAAPARLEKPQKAQLEGYKNFDPHNSRATVGEMLERGGRQAVQQKFSGAEASAIAQLDHADQVVEPAEVRRAALQQVAQEAQAEIAKLDLRHQAEAQRAITAREPMLEAVLEDTQNRLFNQQAEMVKRQILRGRTWLGTKYGQYLESIRGLGDASLLDRAMLVYAFWDIVRTFYEVPPWEGHEGTFKLAHFIGSWVVIHEVGMIWPGLGEAFAVVGGALNWVVIVETMNTIHEAIGYWLLGKIIDYALADKDQECVKTFYLGQAMPLSIFSPSPATENLGLFNMPGSPVFGLNQNSFIFKIKSPEMLKSLVGRHHVVAMRELERRHNLLDKPKPAPWSKDEVKMAQLDRCRQKVEEAALADWLEGYKKLLDAMKEQWEKDKAKQVELERRRMTLPTRGEFDAGLPNPLIALFAPTMGPIPEQGGNVDVSFDWMTLGLPGQKEWPTLSWVVTLPDGSTNRSEIPADEVRFDVSQVVKARTFTNKIMVEQPGRYTYKLEVSLPSGSKQFREGSFEIANEVVVPNLVALATMPKIKAALQQIGLTPAFVAAREKTPSPDKEFTAHDQNPVPNTKVKRGSTVTVAIYPKSASDGAARPCNANEAAAFARLAGSWKGCRTHITISGSCEEATGTIESAEWCDCLEYQKDHYKATFNGRVEGTYLQANWHQPTQLRHPEKRGTGSCSVDPKEGTLSCSRDMACGQDTIKKQ
jgi:hypothetical protein